MADIDIQRKERGAWPWLLGLVVLALLIWGVSEMIDTEPDVAVTDAGEEYAPGTPPPTTEPQPGVTDAAAVGDFQDFVRDSAAAMQEMGREHEYTSEGIRRMTAALESLAAQDTIGGTALDQHVEDLRQKSQRITQDAASTEHANAVRDAFLSGVNLLEQIIQNRQLQGAAESSVQQAREAAESLEPTTPLLEQRQPVHTFFDSMSQAMQGLR